jgi:hypothetical protein
VRAGATMVAVIFVAGLWLVAAPFAVGFPAAHAGCKALAGTDVAVGGVLAVAGFLGLFAALAGRVREMYADAAADRNGRVSESEF